MAHKWLSLRRFTIPNLYFSVKIEAGTFFNTIELPRTVNNLFDLIELSFHIEVFWTFWHHYDTVDDTYYRLDESKGLLLVPVFAHVLIVHRNYKDWRIVRHSKYGNIVLLIGLREEF